MTAESETTVDRTSRHHNWIEIASAILLALATVASAWSAYQATRWHGVQAERYSDADAARINSSEMFDKADQQIATDAATFSDYAFAYFQGDMKLVAFYESNLFRPEMMAALDAWKASLPLRNPDAPKTPFEMEAYKNANREKARALEREAMKDTVAADRAIHSADRYVMLTVLFASVLFFAGISTKFTTLKIKYSMLIAGGLLFLGSVILLAFQPFA